MTVLFVFTFGIVFIVAATLAYLASLDRRSYVQTRAKQPARVYTYTCKGCGSGTETGAACSYCRLPR